MSFTYTSMLWTLLVVPILALLAVTAERRARRGSGRFADPHLLPHVVVAPSHGRVRLTRALQLAAVALLLLGAARPVAEPPLPVNRATVVLAVDASRSMLADDAAPSRLEAALELARRFVLAAPASTRVGLVSFSDGASPLVPPTTAHREVLDALDRITVAQNTSVTAAILAAVRLMPGREDARAPPGLADPAAPLHEDAFGDDDPGVLPPARIVLFSDGGDNVAPGAQLPPELALEVAARFAADHGVSVFTVPVGRDGGAVSRIDGRLFFVPFEREPLERVAAISGGRSVDAGDDAEVAALFRELGREMRWERTPTEVSVLFAAAAVVLMVAAGGVSMSWQRRVP